MNDSITDLFGCSLSQLHVQFAKNRAGLSVMAARAASTGRKVSGYTAEQLRNLALSHGAARLTVQVVGSAVGTGDPIPFVTLNQASAYYRQFCDSNGLASSKAGSCYIRDGARIVAHVSYNGKVWEGKNYDPSAVPLFVPSANH